MNDNVRNPGDLYQIGGGEHLRLIEPDDDGWTAHHITRASGIRGNGTPFTREYAYGDSPVHVTNEALDSYENVGS